MHDTVGKADREKEPGERLHRLAKRMEENIINTNHGREMAASLRKVLVGPPEPKEAKAEAVALPHAGVLNVLDDMVSNQAQRLDALLHELDLLGKDLS